MTGESGVVLDDLIETAREVGKFRERRRVLKLLVPELKRLYSTDREMADVLERLARRIEQPEPADV